MMESHKKSLRQPSLRKRNRQTASVDLAPSRNKSYDRESGLVYDEIEVVAPKSANVGWIGDFATPSLVRTRKRPHEQAGARRLYDMALLKLGMESQDLTVEALQHLPWTIGKSIWESICANHAESFYIWRIFAITFGRDFADPAYRYFLDLRSPTLPIADYQRGITSADNTWLTCLRISPKQVAPSDLMAVSNVSNLAVLDLSDGQHSIENRDSTFDSRIMRSWTELSQSGRAFRSLRVLMLGWQEKVDKWIFASMDSFPKMRLLVITRCRNFDHKTHRDWEEDAWSHGWTFMPSKRGVKHLRSLFEDRSTYTGQVSDMYYESGRDSTSPDPQLSLAPRLPLLEVCFGTPLPWTHIRDEFAGTGTIYFRRKRQEKPALIGIDPGIKQSASQQALGKQLQHSPGPKRRDTKRSAASLLAEMTSMTQT